MWKLPWANTYSRYSGCFEVNLVGYDEIIGIIRIKLQIVVKTLHDYLKRILASLLESICTFTVGTPDWNIWNKICGKIFWE